MSLELTPQQTALVLIDLEHGIVGRELAPHAGKDVVARCAQLAANVRKAGGIVLYVHVLLHEILHLPADQPMMKPGAPPPPPEASDLVPEAGYNAATDHLVAKRQWGAFYSTSLEQQLRRKGIRTVILGGVATNFGVESTARTAYDQGFEVVFAEDAMSTVSPEMHTFAITKIFPIIGRVRTSVEIAEALGSH